MLETGFANFYFAEPHWLAALLFIPMLWLMYHFLRPKPVRMQRLEAFVDAHLLPHLLDNPRARKRHATMFRSLALWSIIWAHVVLAMAGPRWDYTDTVVFRPSSELIILFDLSRSMEVTDVKPSRVARARQEIEDILRYGKGLNIGLIAFAKIPHMITPLTEDRKTIERLLPSIRTDLVYTQGSRIVPALDMAGRMLSQDGKKAERHILIVSDGGYEDPDGQIYRAERALTDKGVRIHVLAVGTAQGGPVPNGKGGYFRRMGSGAVMSALDATVLERIARDGRGAYIQAGYQQDDTQILLSEVGVTGEDQREDGATIIRQWDERFYVFLLPGALLALLWFRRGAAFPVLFLAVLAFSQPVYAEGGIDLFLTKEQKGRKALESKHYEQAEEIFKDDDYRRGVVQYRAGNYEEAARSFAQVKRPEVAQDARYNMGNSELMSGKIEDAIKTYEQILKENPDHKDAGHNLDLARKILEQRNQKQKAGGQSQSREQDPQAGQQQDGQNNQGQGEASDGQQEDQNQKVGEDQQEAKRSQESKNSERKDESQERQSQALQKDSGQQESKGAEQSQSQQQNQGEAERKEGETSDDYPPQPGQEQGMEDQPERDSQQVQEPHQASQDQMQKQEQEKAQSQSSKQQAEDKPEQAQAPKSEDQQQGEEERQNAEAPIRQDTRQDEASQKTQGRSGQEPDKRPKLLDRTLDPNTSNQSVRTPQDVNADQWLNRIESDTETFLRNKFYVESELQGAREGDKPW